MTSYRSAEPHTILAHILLHRSLYTTSQNADSAFGIIDPVNALQCDSASSAPQPTRSSSFSSAQRQSRQARDSAENIGARALGTGGIFPPIALVIGAEAVIPPAIFTTPTQARMTDKCISNPDLKP